MDSVERTLAALSGETYDRTPVVPLLIQHCLEVARIPHSVYSTQPEKMAEAQILAAEQYGLDGFHISSDNYIVSEALGNRVSLPVDQPPQKAFACQAAKADVSLLRKNPDPYTSARMPVMIEATRLARRAVGNRKFIKANCDSGPFTVASSLRGAEALFMDLYDREQYVLDLMDAASDAIVRYAAALAKAGAHAITYGESTGSLVSREQFEAYVLPANRRVVERIKAATGLPVFFHMCGKVDHIVDLMAKTGADCLELDSFTDLGAAYEKTGRSLCITGTVDTVSLLLEGSPQEVYEASLECIRVSGGKRLILSSGCETPRHTPPENIRAMVRAARDAAAGAI